MIASARAVRLLTLSAALLCGCEEAPAARPGAALGFVARGGAAHRVSVDALAEAHPPREVVTEDPYYGESKRFLAIPMDEVLEAGFRRPRAELARESYVLRARDGFAVPIEGARLLEGDAFLAIDDLDVPGFAPIGPAQVSPAPAYLVWSGADRTNLDTHPRPWQLDVIEIAEFESAYPHVLPRGLDRGAPAWRGLAIFRASCIECHAINREGGRVGPDLNVPQSIVEYRPEAQIRAYIRDPLRFRYGKMPPHPDLTEADLDALIAYFRAMADRKHDAEPRR